MQLKRHIIFLFLFISVTGLLYTHQVSASSTQDDLIKNASKYLGTPYLFGGQSPKGFDCSGFTQYVFRDFDIDLPRTAAQQYDTGDSISKSELKEGDLVFFETYKEGPSHLGIYIGNNKFIHASTSNGVDISELSNTYWAPRYLGARRVIEETKPANGLFFDVNKQHWAYDEINFLTKKEFFSVNQNQMFEPNSGISRAEAAVVLQRALSLMPDANHTIKDIEQVDWAESAISSVVNSNIMEPDENGNFHPDQELSREDAAKIFTKAFHLQPNIDQPQTLFKDITENNDSYTAISAVVSNQLISGYDDGTYRPSEKTSRAEFAVLLYRALQPNIVAAQPR